MSDPNPENSNSTERWFEIAVPAFSFGGALLAILFWAWNFPLDMHIPAAGAVIASCILCYLAWIRPKKDIVALSTPIYSIIFFIVPSESMPGIILMVLYAVSLTILLIRLKRRFVVPVDDVRDAKELKGEVKEYVERSRELLTGVGPDLGHSSAVVFVRFAEGNYAEAAEAAEAASDQLNDAGVAHCVISAFNIIREQSCLLDKSLPLPEEFLSFTAEDTCALAKVPDAKFGRREEFDTALENALLLLYAAAWNASEKDRTHLLRTQTFAQRLLMA